MRINLLPESIRGELALLVVVLALPLVALIGLNLYDRARHEIGDAEDEVRRLADAGADRAAQFVEDARFALESIARRPLVRAMDPERCDPALAELLALYPRAGNFLVVNPEGRIICGAIPPPRDRVVRIQDDTLLREVMRAGRFAISRPVVGGINKRWAVAAVQPVRGEDGRVAGTVSMSMDLLNWKPLAERMLLPAGAALSLVTREGIVVARSSDAEHWIGRDTTSGEIHKHMVAMGEGVVRAEDAAGVTRYWGFRPVPGTPWVSLAGIPSEQVINPVLARVLQTGALVALVVGLALWLAIVSARRLADPIRSVARTVRARVEGHDELRIPVAGPRELRDMADEMNRSIDLRRDTERTLSESEERFRALWETSSDAILMIDEDSTIRYASPAVRDVFGYEPDELQGRSLALLQPGPLANAHRDGMQRYLRTGVKRINWRAALAIGRRKDGSEFPVEISFSELRLGGRRLFAGFLADVSDRVKAESALRESEERLRVLNAELEDRVRERTVALQEANKELESFSYSVSHDLRAPVRHIEGFARMLRDELGEPGPKAAHYLRTIAGAATRMGALIEDLLMLSRTSRQSLQLRRVELAPVVEEVLAEVRREAGGRRIRFEVGPLPAVMADAALIRILLLNLLSNAVKYTRPRAEALVEVGSRRAAKGTLEVFVRDNGVGFDMRYAGKLFGVFQRLHRDEDFEGTGIGLATARRILARHHGWIRAEGEPDRGATMTFSLRLAEGGP